MDQQWTAYSDSAAASRQARYAPHNMASPQHGRDPNMPPQIKQDPYASPPAPARTNSMAALPSPGGPQTRGAEYNDVDGDVAMEDADPYKPKYSASRANHQNRQSQQFLQQLQQEESSAARRYSPMNLSPTSPYNGPTQQGGRNYASFSSQTQSSRQSPTRTNPYMSSANNYYSPPGMSPSRDPPGLSAGPLITCCSLTTPSAPTTTLTVHQHEPREFLPTVRNSAAQCCIQQRGPITARSASKSSPTAAHRARAGPKV